VPCSISRCAPVIDNSAQSLEECRSTVDLIDYNKLTRLAAKECICILEPAPIYGTLKI
jgi:hypothetical protein